MAEYFNQLRRLLQIQGESFEEDVRGLVIHLEYHYIETSNKGSKSRSRSYLNNSIGNDKILNFSNYLFRDTIKSQPRFFYILGYQYSTFISAANPAHYQSLSASHWTHLHQR